MQTDWNKFFDKLTESEEPNYFSEGFDAFNRGIRTCPYERGTEAFESWIDGWQDAQMEYEEYHGDCLDESTDNSIYDAHAEYEKDQLKKKEEEDNQENFTFDEGSASLTTIYENILKEAQIKS